jgi:non-specific serine/threonine protein kinase
MPEPHRFRGYELHAAERRLACGGAAVPLGSRAMDVLVALVQRGGGLVTKDELLQSAWPGLVVEEANVHVQVSQLRKLLGADAIATVAGLGYRFAWPLEDGADAVRARALRLLPAERTPFIGRAAALAEASRSLASTRLLTLVGIGGTGKTRLALRLAAQAALHHRDGAAWVDLAPLDDERALAPAVAQALGAPMGSAASPLQALCGVLRERRLLLVLDNCEHLLDAVAALADALLAAAPGLVLLATSREALGLPGELTLPVRPLLLPPAGAQAAEFEDSEAVQFFVDRAQVASPGFHLRDAATAAAVGDICRQLDGIPLALELAAARLKVVSPVQLLGLLRERFLLLAGPRRALARQQTLHAVIRWSYDQLTPNEQALLASLAVCRGGCDLAAVAALSGPGTSAASQLSALSRLAEMSLLSVAQSPGDAARYELLETVRHFGLEALHATAEAATLRDRHALHFLAMAEEHDRQVMSVGTGANLLRDLAREHDNLLQALAWFERDGGGAEAAHRALRLVAALRHYWSARGWLRLGLALTLAAIDRHDRFGALAQAPDRALMRALSGSTQLYRFLGDPEAALPLIRRYLSVAEARADIEGLSVGEGILGSTLQDLGRLDEARSHLDQALAHAQTLGSAPHIADAQHALARWCHACGHTSDALARMEEVLTARRGAGHPAKLAYSLLDTIDYLLRLERSTQAREHLLEILTVLPSIGSSALALFAVDAAAAWLSQQQQHARAAELAAAVQMALRTQQLQDKPDDRARRLHATDGARRALGDEAFAAACSAGESISLPEAMARAERWLATPPPSGPGGASWPQHPDTGSARTTFGAPH